MEQFLSWHHGHTMDADAKSGDFGILIRGGWGRYQALMANFVSAATIVPGALLAYYLSSDFDVTFLLSFAAGNFIYIAASDLIPEVKHDQRLPNNPIHFGAFVGGISVIVVTLVLLEHWNGRETVVLIVQKAWSVRMEVSMPRSVGDRYVCEKCGAVLVYEKGCPCPEGMPHSEICCGEQMKKK